MKLISIILTTYNGEKVIAKTINSILNQVGINQKFKIELIVIDDCSTDHTIEIINQYNLEVIKTPQNSGGPNKGRNIGLRKATGDYICIADQDDVWESHKIVSLLPYCSEVPIVTSGYSVIDNAWDKKIVRIKKNEGQSIYYKKNETFLSRLSQGYIGQNTYLGSIIFSKELKDIPFEEQFGVVDFDWILSLFHERDSIEICDSLYTRYVDSTNLSLNEDYRKSNFEYSLKFIKKYELVYPKETKAARQIIQGSMAKYYYLVDNMKMARFHFSKSTMSLKTFLYYLTSFLGSSFVKRNFKVFG